MVKKPTFDINGMKKGTWSEDEDNKLRAYIQRYGHWNWRLLPKFAGLSRSGKSCRLRWVNYLRPDVKHGNFTKEEDDLIIELQKKLGNKWSEMTTYLPGRSDNEIKNRWHRRVKKCAKKDRDVLENECIVETTERDQANTKESVVDNLHFEFHRDVKGLLAESPLSSPNTNLPPCWFSDLKLADGSSDDISQLANHATIPNFWREPFLSDNNNIISSSDNLFLTSEFGYPVSI